MWLFIIFSYTNVSTYFLFAWTQFAFWFHWMGRKTVKVFDTQQKNKVMFTWEAQGKVNYISSLCSHNFLYTQALVPIFTIHEIVVQLCFNLVLFIQSFSGSCGCENHSGLLLHHQTGISLQLNDALRRKFGQTFRVPRGFILMTWRSPVFFCGTISRFKLQRNISTSSVCWKL